MSGIFGIVGRDAAPVPAAELARMRDAMAAWGGDRAGAWHEGAVGLGHVLRGDTPESFPEQQPATLPEAPFLRITADARLENREELLGALDCPATSTTDDQVILRAYLRWGVACADRLLGAFAFALWDGRARRLLLARDAFGLRPLHYHVSAARLVFASDVRAVLAADGVPRRVDEPMVIAHYASTAHHARLRRSYLEGVHKVAPGTVVEVDASRLVEHTYFRPEPRPTLGLRRPEDYVEAIRAELEAAVARSLRTAHPVGAHLSGGLDSASVTVLAARALRARGSRLARVYSWSPPPGARRDGEHARIDAICAREGLACAFTELSPQAVRDYERRDVALEPSETLLHELALREAARGDGVGVVLSGWGGDEGVSFHADGHLAGLVATGRWLRWARELQARRRLGAGTRGLLRETLLPFEPDALRRLLGRDLGPAAAHALQRGVVRRSELPPVLVELLRDTDRRNRARPGARAMLAARLANGHLTLRAEAWAAAGARFGIDYRYPLLDRRLVELVLSLPDELLCHGGWARYPLRAAMDRDLPRAICWSTDKREPAKWRVQGELAREAGVAEASRGGPPAAEQVRRLRARFGLHLYA